MKTQSTTPDWAVELVKEVCKAYHRAAPKQFSWYNTKNEFSSGYTWYFKSKIHVSAGTNDAEARTVLLHELSHWILTKRKPVGHTVKFWQLFVELNKQYGDINEAYKRDVEVATMWRPNTRAKAIQVFAEHGIGGTK